MEFRILGVLNVLIDGHRVDVGGVRLQTVLACLLLDANRTVTVSRLVDAIYGANPPATARTQVQICISSLRRLFAGLGHPDLITTHGQGYVIEIGEDRLDAQRFEKLVLRARKARGDARSAEAVARYREALSLWRGPALDGIPSHIVQTSTGRFAELRIAASEECIDLELAMGRHGELVGELMELVAEHPLRERLRGQLMIALYRSGRQAEALHAYRLARQTMVDELGIEPDERLQRLEQAILTSDRSLVQPTGSAEFAKAAPVSEQPPPVPRLLPTDIADFTGRAEQISDIERHLSAIPANRAVPIVVMVGMPGIGKTSIAIHASHRIVGHYPDGQLFANLHGDAPHPVRPAQVLERFLRALGVPGAAIPEGLEERAEMYRGLLADLRVLVVLDDAVNESQVLPLLPGNPGSAVLVTSRNRLTGLPGVKHVQIELFDADQSLHLLSQIAGAGRVHSEAESAVALAELCGHLPLALRIVGARLSARPHWRVEQLLRRMEDETRRLDELEHGNLAIRATITLTYESVGEDARRLLRRLAIMDAAGFSGWVGAALLDTSVAESEDLFDELADAQLIEVIGVEGGAYNRYRFHDLIRVFARERLVCEEPVAERDLALKRVLGALLFLTETAHQREYGGAYVQVHSSAPRWKLPARVTERLVDSPSDWYERERMILVPGIHQAAQAGLADLCWDLAISAVTLFEARMFLDDWRDTHQIALEAARQARDIRGEAAMLYSIGSLHIYEQRYADAARNLEEAEALFKKADDRYGAALVIRNIAFLERMADRSDEASVHYLSALETFREFGDRVAAAFVLHNLAKLELDRGRIDAAVRMLSEALLLSRDAGSRRVEAQVLHGMGDAYLLAREPRRAADVLEQALTHARDAGDLVGEAYTLHGLGIARLRLGETAEAGPTLREAFRKAGSAGDRLVQARILLGLGEFSLACGNPAEAVAHCRQARTLFQKIGAPFLEARVLEMLSDAHAAEGDQPAARAAAAEARALPRRWEPSAEFSRLSSALDE